MFLVIMEDGQVFKTESITSDDGYITIIDMKDNTIHWNGTWEEIEDFEH